MALALVPLATPSSPSQAEALAASFHGQTQSVAVAADATTSVGRDAFGVVKLAPPAPPQFFWLWAPTNFDDASLFFHSNDDAAGLPWNRRAVWTPDDGPRSTR